MIPLSWILILSAALFCIGLFGVLARRNAIAILLGVELMLNAVNINLVAFWRYLDPIQITGQKEKNRHQQRQNHQNPVGRDLGIDIRVTGAVSHAAPGIHQPVKLEPVGPTDPQ